MSYHGPHVVLTPSEVRTIHKMLVGVKLSDADLAARDSIRVKVDWAMNSHPVFRQPVP